MRLTAAATAAAVLVSGLLTAHAAPSSSAQQGSEIHLLRRRSTRPEGMPLHEHLRAEKARLRNKYAHNRKRIEKYQRRAAGLPDDVEKRAQEEEQQQQQHHQQLRQTRQKRDGSAQFGTQTNTLYYAAVTVGTPPQSFPVGIDSGSSDLWISSQDWNGARVSSTFKRNGNPFGVQYEDGTGVTGYQGTDKVSFAGYSATTALSVGTNLSQNAAPAPADGIFGFGFPPLATGQEPAFWQTSGANVFSMYLASTDDFRNSYSYGGLITLGTPNASLYTGSINYVPITQPIYWTIPLQGLTSGGSRVSIPSNQPAVIDSGTSLIGAPNSIVQQFYSNIPNARPVSGAQGEGFYEYPCSNSNLGIAFTFGGQSISVPDENFVFDRDGSYCIGALFENGSDGSQSDDSFIVGDSFMRGVYTIFDGTKSAVGFAALSSSVPTTGPDFTTSGSGNSNGNGNSGGSSSNGNGGGGFFGGIFGAAPAHAGGVPAGLLMSAVVGASMVLGAAAVV